MSYCTTGHMRWCGVCVCVIETSRGMSVSDDWQREDNLNRQNGYAEPLIRSVDDSLQHYRSIVGPPPPRDTHTSPLHG